MSPNLEKRAPTGGAAPSAEARALGEKRAEDALPLRLSVARGALGVELTRSLPLGGVSLEELVLSLPGLAFPLDLSKGVKQFRSRRTLLERLAFRVDCSQIAQFLQSRLSQWEEFSWTQVRVIPAVHGEADSAVQDVSLSFTFFSEVSVLAFELVWIAGVTPRVVLDAVRGEGLSVPPLQCALRVLDSLLASFEAELPWVQRRGRILEFRGVARLLCLESLPSWGFRLPQIREPLVPQIQLQRGEFLVSLDAQADLQGLGPRGVRLTGWAELVARADDLLVQGEVQEARQAYLEALEFAPKNADLLLTLAELDLAVPGRALSAWGLLEEREHEEYGVRAAWAFALEARALQLSSRVELSGESYRRAAELEPDGLLSAWYYLRWSQTLPERERGAALQSAARRAPQWSWVRLERFKWRVQHGDLVGALADAEHLEACEQAGEPTARLCAQVGEQFLLAGYEAEALSWLMRGFRHAPEDPMIRFSLAQAWAKTGELLRAVEALQSLPEESWPAAFLERRNYQLAVWLSSVAGDKSLAFSFFRKVDTRSRWGARARAEEGKLAWELGDTRARLKAHQRLFDAVELGLLNSKEIFPALLTVAQTEEMAGHREMALRAARLLDKLVQNYSGAAREEEELTREMMLASSALLRRELEPSAVALDEEEQFFAEEGLGELVDNSTLPLEPEALRQLQDLLARLGGAEEPASR